MTESRNYITATEKTSKELPHEDCRGFQRVRLSADTLRYYERIGLLPRVHRNENGVRDYDEQDCARIKFVKCMRGASVSIEALIEYMQLLEQGDETMAARRAILEEQRDQVTERIAEMQAGLDRLNYKIAHYDDLIHACEQEIAK